MTARTLVFMLLVAGCQRPAPEALTARPLVPSSHGPAHADPDAPFALEITTNLLAPDVAELRLRVTPSVDVPSLTLGFDLPQPLTRFAGDAERSLSDVRAHASVEFTARVRRTTPGPSGVTVRAWVQCRGTSVVLGDERTVTLFGEAPTEQPPSRERIVRAPDGGLLHDTVIE
jgi:hypothetical protein